MTQAKYWNGTAWVPGFFGAAGPQGTTGDTGTISVGTTSTLSAGSNATVSNTGTSTNAVFNFGIPQGPAGPQGPSGSSSSHYHYSTRTNTTSGDPTANQLGWNNATQINSTSIRVNHLDADGQDDSVFLDLISENDVLIIQDKNDATNYQKWRVSGTPTYNATWDEFPVTLISSSGTGTNFQNNHPVILIIVSVGSIGPAGPGVAAGGTTGQVLSKVDATNYNTQWTTLGTSSTLDVATTGNNASTTQVVKGDDSRLSGLPQTAPATSTYTVLAADAGKHIYASAVSAINFALDLSVAVGTTITIVSVASAITVTLTGTGTLYIAGTGQKAGTVSMPVYGLATFLKIGATTWMVSGNGLS
jgi:hypothetical protein